MLSRICIFQSPNSVFEKGACVIAGVGLTTCATYLSLLGLEKMADHDVLKRSTESIISKINLGSLKTKIDFPLVKTKIIEFVEKPIPGFVLATLLWGFSGFLTYNFSSWLKNCYVELGKSLATNNCCKIIMSSGACLLYTPFAAIAIPYFGITTFLQTFTVFGSMQNVWTSMRETLL